MIFRYLRLIRNAKKSFSHKTFITPLIFNSNNRVINPCISSIIPSFTLPYGNRVSINNLHTTASLNQRIKSKVSYSSLLKHKNPDGLTGNERRRKLIKESYKKKYAPKAVSKNTRGFIPTRFKLERLESDIKKPKQFVNQKLTYEILSARQKFKEREKKRNKKPKINDLSSLKPKEITKFDMAEAETIRSLERKVIESTFNNMEIYPSLLEAIPKLFPNIEPEKLKPTEIQALAIPELLKNKTSHVLCAAETGSGKTLAYLIPVISKLKENEASNIDFKKIDKSITPRNKDFGTDENDPFKNGTVSSIEESNDINNEVLDQAELRLLTTSNVRRLNRPRAIILVPSCALAEQVHAVAKKLSHLVKFRTALLTRSTVRKDFLRRLNTPIDMIVTTPSSLMRYLSSKTLSLSDTIQLVIDEADTMFEKGFANDVKNIIKGLQQANKDNNRKYQIQVVSATLPKLVLQTLDKLFPDLVRITTPSLHKAIPGCKQHFVDLKDYQGNRQLALLDILRQFDQRTSCNSNQKSKDRIIIFCNTRKSVSIAQAFLQDRKIPCLSLYGGEIFPNTPPASPNEIQEFLYPSSVKTLASYDFSLDMRESDKKKSIENDNYDLENSKNDLNGETAKYELKSKKMDNDTIKNELSGKNINKKQDKPKILICTDLASRGLDTASVNHVILYDFPTSVVDFLHRCGRTARAGKTGIVTALVGKKDRALADRIKRSVRTKTVIS